MSLVERVQRAREALRSTGRISLRLLRQDLGLDDKALELVVEELVEVQQVARRDGSVLVWVGEGRPASTPAVPPAAPIAETPPGAPAPDSGERRQLTVLFCDLVGSTELSSRLDPEEWHGVLRRYQEAAAAVLHPYGGHVAQYLGDGLLIYFGWPRSYDDAAERAVRAALGLVDAAASVEADGFPLSVRVGLHTGPVVVSTLGGEGRSETLALGDVPNVAARLQGAAEPGTVLVSAATQRLVAGLFVVEDLGPHELKGVREPVTLYRVVQPSGLRSRLDVAAGRLTRFVGREVELTTLTERWERARDGEGQTVLVLGEAGIGKSRLAYELRERLLAVPHTWLACGATPYAQGTPFHPVIALLSQALAFAPDDTTEEKLSTLERGLGKLATAEAVALVADFLGLPLPTPLEMSPDLQRRRTIDLLAQWNLALSEVQPLVVVVEDLHWCDASSLELLGRLMAQSATARVLVLATARPEFTLPWPARESVTTLSLGRLTKRQAREMIAAQAGGDLPAETLEALVARADGVPLFVEELTKAVVGPEVARGIEAIPATLADSLMARLDRLTTAKEVAQRAAVLGREFPYPLLAAVAGLEEAALRRGLTRLVDAEILFARGEPPESTYTFKHALVQQAAYESLLKRTRQQLHSRVVDVLAAGFSERQAGPPELVARHAEVAGRIEEAVTFYQRAGELAQGRSAHQEAIGLLRHAVALLATQPEGEKRDAREVVLQLALGGSLNVTRGFAHPEVEAAFERARLLCQAAGDARRLGFALIGLASCYSTHGEVERGRALAARVLTTAEENDDEELALAGHALVAVPETCQGKFASALAHCEAVRALYEPGRHHMLASMLAGDRGVIALCWAGWNLWALGSPDRALTRAREAVALARRLAHPFSLAEALFFETGLHWMRRHSTSQRERAAETIALCEAQGFPLYLGAGTTLHAAARIAEGEVEAVADVLAGLALAAETGNQMAAPALFALLGEAYIAAGQLSEARGTVEGGLVLATQTGQLFMNAELYRLGGGIVLAGGGAPAEAEVAFHRALEIACSQHAKSLELRAATSLARLWQRQGRDRQARELLAPVYGWFTEGFDTLDLIDAKALLGELGA